MQQKSSDLEQIPRERVMKIADLLFDKNGVMFQHLTRSFNKLIAEDIPVFLTNNDNMFFTKIQNDKRYQYFFKYTNIRILKPMMKNNIDKMYPQYARIHNMSYSCQIIADIAQYQTVTDINTHQVITNLVGDVIKNQIVTRLPVMLQSQYCNLTDDLENKHKYGECKYDYGGYFIINGAEKVVIPQNRLTDNKMLVFSRKETNQVLYICQVNSKPANIKRIPQIISIRIDKSKQIVLQSPIFQEVSIVVILKALGLVQDADIFNAILQGTQNNSMIRLIEQLINNHSIDDQGEVISTKEHAVIHLTNKIKILKKFNLNSTINRSDQNRIHVEEILQENFIPHLTCDNISKAYYICNMIRRLITCFLGIEPVDDRDSYVNKRIDLPGDLIFDLFKQYHKKMLKESSRIFNQKNQSDEQPANIVEQIKSSFVEQNIKLALVTGQWPKQSGVSQVVQRQTYLQPFSLMRRVDTPSGDATSQKLTGPRMIHASTTGFLCLTGDSLISLPNGRYKQIKNIKDGDEVLTMCPQRFKVSTTKVKNWFCKEPQEKLLKITLEDGTVIKCTKDHVLYFMYNKRPFREYKKKFNDEDKNKMLLNYVSSKQIDKMDEDEKDQLIDMSMAIKFAKETDNTIDFEDEVCEDKASFLRVGDQLISGSDYVPDQYELTQQDVQWLRSHTDITDLSMKKKQTQPNLYNAIPHKMYELREQEFEFTGEQYLTLARLIGYLQTDGSMSISEVKKHSQCDMSVGEYIDSKMIYDDMASLGVKTRRHATRPLESCKPTITCKFTRKIGKKDELNMNVTVCGSQSIFFWLFGGIAGKKTTSKFSEVPEWILNGPLAIKQQYIDGLFSGDGTKVNLQNDKMVNQLSLFKSCANDVLEHHMRYLEQIQQVMNDLGIKTTITGNHNQTQGLWKKQINVNGQQNITKLLRTITYRYCAQKRRESTPLIHHALNINYHMQHAMKYFTGKDISQSNSKQYTYRSEYFRTNQTIQMDDEYEYDESIFTDNSQKLLNNDPKLVEAIKGRLVKRSWLFLKTIVKIEEIDEEPVYDFETVSGAHTFFVNGILSHNCVVSSPEHAAVGRIRHLALVGGITVSDHKQHVKAIEHAKKYVKQITDIPSDDIYKYFKVYVNGDWIGITDNFMGAYNEFLKLKLKYNQTGVILDFKHQEIKIYTDSGRLIRPVLKVKNNRLVLTEEMISSISFNPEDYGKKVVTFFEFMKKYPEAIENVCMEEQPYKMIAYSQKKLIEMEKRREDIKRVLQGKEPKHDKNMHADLFKNVDIKKIQNRYQYAFADYTLCEIHESLLQAEIPINIPFMNSNQGPRNIFQYSQGRQAQNIYATNHNERFDNTFVLSQPTQKLITTLPSKYTNGNILTPGQTVIVAIACFKGFNQEDSNILNQSSVERGMFRAHNYKKYHSIIEKNFQTNTDGKFGQLDEETTQGISKVQNNSKLNKHGYAPLETTIHKGDAIIGKMVPLQQSVTGQSNYLYRNESEYYRQLQTAVVDKVIKGHNIDGHQFIKMKLRSERRPMIGDKFSSCFTSDHELLTEQGWMNIKEFTTDPQNYLNVKIACFKNQMNDSHIQLTYDYVDGVTVAPYEGRLMTVNNVQMTPNHVLYVKQDNKWHYKEVQHVSKSYQIRQHASSWVPDYNVNRHEIDKRLVLNDQRTIIRGLRIGHQVYPIDDFIKYFALYLNYGFTSPTSKYTVNIRVTDEKVKHSLDTNTSFDFLVTSQKKIENPLRKKCPCKYKSKCTCEKNVEQLIQKSSLNELYSLHDIQLRNYLSNIEQVDYMLPQWVFQLNQEQSLLLVKSLLIGSSNDTLEVHSDCLADDYVRLALHAGLSANTFVTQEGSFLVHFNSTDYIDVDPSQEQESNFEGTVYCVTAKYDHLIYIRRSGKNKSVPYVISQCHGQKSTCGTIIPSEDLYQNEYGMTPDLILNPNAIPSRMTIGQLMESICSKLTLLNNQQIDGTPFMDLDMEEIKNRLEQQGFPRDGTERMYNGQTGESVNSMIFIGPTHYCALKHIAQSKCFAVSKAQRVQLTRGVAQGRSTMNGNGGLRLGEMERDAVVAHGMGKFLKEKLMDITDAFKVYICQECGYFAQRQPNMQSQRTMRDTDQYVCMNCQKYTQVNPTIIPYAFKLLLQELQAISVQACIKVKDDVYTRVSGLENK